MSFMFNPHPYDDPTAINRPPLSPAVADALVVGAAPVADRLVRAIEDSLAARPEAPHAAFAFDGYPTACWERPIQLVAQALRARGIGVRVVEVASLYKDAATLERELAPLLPTDRDEDPVLLFGKLNRHGYDLLFDADKLAACAAALTPAAAGAGGARDVTLLVGCGAADRRLRAQCAAVVYFDVTPKRTVLRVKHGDYRNLGDVTARPFKETLRRCYYVDFEAAGALRGELLREAAIDFYIASDDPDRPCLLPQAALAEVLAALVRSPFRCKPVYLEGVWGGQYVKRTRALPAMRNIAWVFDLIPLEVSLVAEIGQERVEFPFFTVVQREGDALMGKACVAKFGGYFPIRFNYDDTYHASGNMSIQVHPDASFARTQFDELGRQDESYYIVVAGPGAQTYVGLREEADAEAFLRAVQRSERDRTPVDHDAFVHAIPSTPGRQLLLPAGTVHASGRNQVVLEIGSLTVGSYTFKLYDYLRADLDGVPRPIHARYGERVLKRERRAAWVGAQLAPPPRLLRRGDGFVEWLLGEQDLLYFSLRRLDFVTQAEDDTAGRFHVLALVDGERVRVESVAQPELGYDMNDLDIIVVPANVGRYVLRNLGNQPVSVHKTLLKDGFEHD